MRRSQLARALFASMLATILPISVRAQQCQSGENCDLGLWAGPWEYNGDVCSSYACVDASVEFYHGALLPVGRYAGHVMLLRASVDASCFAVGPAETWILNPENPEHLKLVLVGDPPDAVPSNQTCAGQSWDRNGRFVLAGGSESGHTNKAVWRFDPRALGQFQIPPIGQVGQPMPCGSFKIVGGGCWTQLGDMNIPRYYGTLIPLIRWAIQLAGSCTNGIDGANLVFSGPPHSVLVGTPPGAEGNEVFELLDPDHPTGQWSCPLLPEGFAGSPHDLEYAPLDQTPGTFEQYERKPDGTNEPNPLLDSYARGVQTSGKGEIVIGGDTKTNAGMEPPGDHYAAALNGKESWTMKVPYANNGVSDWELHRIEDTDVEHTYGNLVIHFRRSTALPFSYEHNRIVQFGGGYRDPTLGFMVNIEVEEFDLTTGMWADKQDMASKREFSNAVTLADGSIVIVGGTAQLQGSLCDPGIPVFQPELYDIQNRVDSGSTRLLRQSNTANWPGQPMTPVPHMYHSMAMLLKDGSVLVVGGKIYSNTACVGGAQVYPDSRLSAEIFYPPYLFENNAFAPRPSIDGLALSDTSFQQLSTSTQARTLTIVATTSVGGTGPIKKVTIVRPAAITHHFDSDQRYIELDFIGGGTGQQQLTVTAPREDVAPQGYYMLFVLEERSPGRLVPSIAAFVQFL